MMITHLRRHRRRQREEKSKRMKRRMAEKNLPPSERGLENPSPLVVGTREEDHDPCPFPILTRRNKTVLCNHRITFISWLEMTHERHRPRHCLGVERLALSLHIP